jgi:hypothetical protein
MSPGPISQSNPGSSDDAPYVPSWCYSKGPRMCPCGHHEGFHNDAGECVRSYECGCFGLPDSCLTPTEDL